MSKIDVEAETAAVHSVSVLFQHIHWPNTGRLDVSGQWSYTPTGPEDCSCLYHRPTMSSRKHEIKHIVPLL